MREGWPARLLLGVLLLAAAGVFCTGITWGLPSRNVDPYLFGEAPAWSGEKIQRLAGDLPDDPARGADIDVDPITRRDQIVCINETDEQRAEILRRYRLYTYNPDEMVTMRALGRMKPGLRDFDPKLYQYGGLWIYPVGALLKLASMCGAVKLVADPVYHLDHPEAFGRFYVVARLYTVAWALVGVWAIFKIVHRLTGGCLPSAAAATLCVIAMPVVVTMAHEAKPHLPGAVLVLLAVMAAARYAETGRRLWWAVTACLCGAAFGMVLAAWPVFIILPVMTLLRRQAWRQRISTTLIGGLIGGGVYFATNPYVLINLFANRELLWSNLSNTRAMFHLGPPREALSNAVILLFLATSPLLALAGVVGALDLAVRRKKGDRTLLPARPVGCFAHNGPVPFFSVLAGPTLLVLVQFVAFAAGQPPEYARFAVLPAVVLAIAAVAVIRLRVQRIRLRRVMLFILTLTTVVFGYAYEEGFVRDCGAGATRLAAAQQLQKLIPQEAETVALFADPAPYNLPPLDLFRCRILLLPEDAHVGIDRDTMPADVIVGFGGIAQKHVGPACRDRIFVPLRAPHVVPTPISWASKTFVVVRDRHRPGSTTREGADAP